MLDLFKAQSRVHQHIISLAVISVLLFLSTSLFYQSRLILNYEETSDFSAYYSAYMIKRELGEGIYDRENFENVSSRNTVKGSIREYLYPPLMAETLSVFMPSNYTHARLLWVTLEHGFLFILFILSVLITTAITKAPMLYATSISAFVVIGFSAVERSFFYGQASLVMVVLVYTAVYLRILEHRYLAAFLAALATLLKIYPLAYLPALLIQRRYLESVVYVASLASIAIGFISIFGTHDWLNFVRFQGESPLVDRDGLSKEAIASLYEVPNYSPTALLFLLSDQLGLGYSAKTLWHVAMAAVLGSALLTLALCFNRLSKEISFLHILSLGFIGVMLISPLLWNHIFTLLIPVYAVLLTAIYSTDSSRAKDLILITASFSLVAFPDLMVNLPITNNGFLVALKFTKLYGLLMLAYILFPISTTKPSY